MKSVFGTQKSPYAAVWIAALALIFLPMGLYRIFYALLMTQSFSKELNRAAAQVIAGAIGTMNGGIFLLCGGLGNSFQVVCSRVREFFLDLRVSPKKAFRWYFDSIRADGAAFWCYLACLLPCPIVAVLAAIRFVGLYHP